MSSRSLIVEILIIFFVISQKWMLLLLWIIPYMMLQMSYYTGNECIYMEIIEDYPIEDCIKPKHFKKFFKKLSKLSYKELPKELYYRELLRLIGFSIYSIMFILLLLLEEYTHLIAIGGIYIRWDILVIFFSGYILFRKAFLARYKRLNKYNFKYLFLSKNVPYPKKVGKCKIIREGKRWRSNIVTVSVIETGEVKEKVLLQGKKKEGDDPIYSLYEICKVYYIV